MGKVDGCYMYSFGGLQLPLRQVADILLPCMLLTTAAEAQLLPLAARPDLQPSLPLPLFFTFRQQVRMMQEWARAYCEEATRSPDCWRLCLHRFSTSGYAEVRFWCLQALQQVQFLLLPTLTFPASCNNPPPVSFLSCSSSVAVIT